MTLALHTMGFRFGLLSNRICKRSPDGIRSGSIMSDDVPTKQQLLEAFVPVPVWWPRRPHRPSLVRKAAADEGASEKK